MFPSLLLLIFIALVALLRKLSAIPGPNRLFLILPVPFWCYFLPMVGTTLGWIPQSSPLYTFLSQQLLPVCLVLLLIGTDLKALTRMGPMATFLMLAGSAGTIAGGLASFFLYRQWLPADAWGGIGALTGSWIGGSANMLAVKEALQVPDRIIAPLIIVDAGVAYSWMALLIWSSSQETRWNRWVRTTHRNEAEQSGSRGLVVGQPGIRHRPTNGPAEVVEQKNEFIPRAVAKGWIPTKGVEKHTKDARMGRSAMETTLALVGLLADCRAPVPRHPTIRLLIGVSVSILLTALAQWLGRHLPALGSAINASTWTILIVTSATLLLSLTPLRTLEQAGLSQLGSFALYVLLASIGARANLTAILQTPAFLALGLTWIAIHGLFLLIAGYLMRAPLGLIATASQANIGGPISAPIVGATFSPQLASVGLLMAILGNILGTYLGLASAGLAHHLSGV